MKLNLVFLLCFLHLSSAGIPIVINTWNFQNSTIRGWNVLKETDNALDALEEGCKVCQDEQCDHTVGFGGSPDENGETTLDALVFDGNVMDMGAVGGLRRIKNVIGVARKVLEHTKHSLLVGDLATDFAKNFGFLEESLQTNYSKNIWEQWKATKCQPNFWKDVYPDSETSCGPYHPSEYLDNNIPKDRKSVFDSKNHDTIGMIAISSGGHVVAGTSTNGAKFKIPGRVGDSPIPGAGAYADSEIGAAVATGDGDIMMRFLPSFLAVEQMRLGASPTKAAKIAIGKIVKFYPNFAGAVLACTKKGEYGAACNGIDLFPFVVGNAENDATSIKYIRC